MTSAFSERTKDIEQSQTRRQEVSTYLQFVRGLLLRRPLDELGSSKPADYLRAAVVSGNLDALKNTAASFVQVVDQATLIGGLLPLAVPGAVNAPLLDVPSALTAHLVADGEPVPVDRIDLSSTTLPPQMLKSLFVFDARAVDSPDPKTRKAFDAALVTLLRAAWDSALVNFLASHAVPVGAGSGGSLASALADGLAVLSNGRPRVPVVITSVRAAGYLAASGGVFETVRVDGTGHIAGMPCLISPSAGNQLVIVDAGHFAMNDGGTVIESGGQSAIEMDDVPGNSAVTGTGRSLVSMFQVNAMALRVQRWISWALLTSDAVVSVELTDLAGSPS